jgi:hypothetical protein
MNLKLINLLTLNTHSLLTLHYAKLLGAEKAVKTFQHEMKDKVFCCVYKFAFLWVRETMFVKHEFPRKELNNDDVVHLKNEKTRRKNCYPFISTSCAGNLNFRFDSLGQTVYCLVTRPVGVFNCILFHYVLRKISCGPFLHRLQWKLLFNWMTSNRVFPSLIT